MRAGKIRPMLLALLSRPFSAPQWVAFEPLQLPPYRYLLLNNVFGVMGAESRLMAQAWLILTLTNSDAWVGSTAGLPALLAAVMALLGGVLADRLERRAMLIVLTLSLSFVALLTALLVATDTVQLWHLLALAFVIALLNVSGSTVSQTMIADIVPRAQLFSANALYSASANLAIVVGPLLAGILLSRVGVEYAFYFSAFLYIGSALTLTRIRVEKRTQGKSVTSVWQDLKGGLHYVAQTAVLQWLLVLGLTVVAVGVWFALLPRFARDVLDSGATGYGAILSARGIGGLVGMITLIAAGRVKRLALVLMACSLGFATLVVGFSFSSSMLLATIFAFGLGIVFVWWPSSLRTAFQLAATDEMRGRVMSLFSLVAQILTLGWFVGGVLSEIMGPRAAMILVGILCAGLNVLAYLRSHTLRNIGRDEQ